MQATAGELQAVAVSRLVGPGDRIEIGANVPTFWCGVMLALVTHSYGVRLRYALAVVDGRAITDMSPPEGATRFDLQGAVAYIPFHEVFDDWRRTPDLFAAGAIEVDRYGNMNLAGIPNGEGWERRSVGPIGTTTMCAVAKRLVIIMSRHDLRTFVKRCRYITGLGWGEDGRSEYRGEYRGGPVMLLSPLGIFDFNDDHRLRLKHVMPGVTADEIDERSSFPIDRAEGCEAPLAPTAAELDILRTQVDSKGVLRRES